MAIAIAWTLLLTRNRRVFDNETTQERMLETHCMDIIRLWSYRCRKLDRRVTIREWVNNKKMKSWTETADQENN
jgi:hypothetical protein